MNPVFRFFLRTAFFIWYLVSVVLIAHTFLRWVLWKLGRLPNVIYPGREFSVWYWLVVAALLGAALCTVIRWAQGRIPDEDHKSWFSRPSGL